MRHSGLRCNFPVAFYNTTLHADEARFRLTAAGGGVGDINLFHTSSGIILRQAILCT
jgi:hypothetical protein